MITKLRSIRKAQKVFNTSGIILKGIHQNTRQRLSRSHLGTILWVNIQYNEIWLHPSEHAPSVASWCRLLRIFGRIRKLQRRFSNTGQLLKTINDCITARLSQHSITYLSLGQ